ncbi:MAG: ASCH domain-containing protein [Opitutaceae bacterium]|nr:ASCH domain-containing protein [Opitutaceae bacterium]
MDALPFTEFGLTPEDNDLCARDVLSGKKGATTSLHAAYAHDGEPLPWVGKRSRVRDGHGRAVAIIEVTTVAIRPFNAVGADYAQVEGAGDGSLSYWRAVHVEYLQAECARIGLPWSDDVAVVLETFRLVETLPAG